MILLLWSKRATSMKIFSLLLKTVLTKLFRKANLNKTVKHNFDKWNQINKMYEIKKTFQTNNFIPGNKILLKLIFKNKKNIS